MTNPPELLAPAGDWDCVRAAVANGADAVFFGMPTFNARMRAENFDDLPAVVTFLHNHGVKAYVTFNVLVFTEELAAAADQLRELQDAGVDAVIIQDVGLADLARRITPGLRVHASTQMTITSPEGVAFARDLGVRQVVLARELSMRELAKFDPGAVPLEVFVHGALCVAYSGQCLTSESLGQRSANRGECAQACRMPYELVVDGATRDLGDRRYLLSPQDLAAVEEIPKLVALGVRSFKIEGRLKSPEYVAAVTSVYRMALDAAIDARAHDVTANDWYRLEMTFSRGLFSGWMHGVNHQRLVPARFGKKRGPFVGRVTRVGRSWVDVDGELALSVGDGVVFDSGGDTDAESGGRIVRVTGRRVEFDPKRTDLEGVTVGDRVWKTDDPSLGRDLRGTYAGHLPSRRKAALDFCVSGRVGEPLRISARGVTVESAKGLEAARNQPLTTERLAAQLGKLDETPFSLGVVDNAIEGEVIVPISELNRLRRELIYRVTERTAPPRIEVPLSVPATAEPEPGAALSVLCRTMEQLEAAFDADVLLVDFEDVRRYRDAVALVRASGLSAPIFLATPRIQKAGERGFFKLIENAAPDGVLIRNVGAIEYFRGSSRRRIGDFSLNVANPLTARVFKDHELERLTISYDLTIGQVLALLAGAPAEWFELTIHQHMPMFHMEHCVFAAFLSDGTDHTNCGRPCDTHRVHLRDRVGVEHPLRADVGCRNTLFNAKAQTGAKFFEPLVAAGLRNFRVELLEESPDETRRILETYRALLDGQTTGENLWRHLRAQPQLGVTQGTY